MRFALTTKPYTALPLRIHFVPTMTFSAIPARLDYQCGHAALVSLPRIKGETSVQRTERITREKAAAQARACDFCGPDVAIVVQATAPDVEAVSQPDVEQVVEAVLNEVLEAPVVEPVAVELVVVEPVATDDTVLDVELSEAVAEAVAEIVALAESERGPEPVGEAAEEEPSATTARATRRRRSTRSLEQELRTFTVQYRVERVIDASDIGDALRRVTQLGATDVLAISRA